MMDGVPTQPSTASFRLPPSRCLRRLALLAGVVGWLGACAVDAPAPAAKARPEVPTAGAASADLVLRGGRIVTVDSRFGVVEALAARGGRILAVGKEAEIRRHVGPHTRVLDLQGATAFPGFIEGHGHFIGLGEARQILDLTHAETFEDIVAMVGAAARAKGPGEWIEGRGWHQEKWRERPAGHVRGFPRHDAISAVTPENPVVLRHASGHASLVNARAMALAGISDDTRDPPGGEIVRDERGRAVGVLRETAQELVDRVRRTAGLRRSRRAAEARLARAAEIADRECLAKGVTSFQDAGSSVATIDVLRRLVEEGRLRTRLWVMVREPNARLARRLADYRMVGFARHHLTVRAIKRTLDGALGARGAWLLEPYADAPHTSGLNTAPIEDVEETARLARRFGYQLCVHAIGDRANREILDLYERVWADDPAGLAEARWRVEHAQHLHPDDIPRFGRLGVIASMQGIHCTSDAPWVIPRLGVERARSGAYVWRSLIDSGALVINGTDTPVEDVDPIACFYASVTRRTKDGSRFFPGQCMTRMEALRSYTIHAARAAFEEDLKGSLSPGKLADVVVLSNDLLTVPEDKILSTEVLYTIVGGEVVWAARR